ncbi:sodium:calcium antiporter [Natrarchaeobius chitinivorans]|uniref:Sodium/calcium exchanger membrane region domain-containing protein n=1 Tax=Natrarchaeobius chitinivorans TaxID=1679083 RepID=A0A3N6ND17_NATCH|nr:hypothetical protein [Natrarchaeobius chitinivorans]RQG96672.1 hypothetical protein EA473_06080 [Natrarchaeobius chitinivorans]
MVVGDVAALVAGTLALWIGARLLVTGASRLAGAAGVSPLVIGLTVVAFGTSAPEIVVSTGAALDGRGTLSIGNVVGSNVFDLLGVLGIAAVIRPTDVGPVVGFALAWLAVLTAFAAMVLATGQRVT